MKSLKLNLIEKERLSKKEMSEMFGGNVCNCGCYYRDSGGSSIEANGSANWSGNKSSYIMTADAALMIDDGKGGCVDFWRLQ